MTQHGLRTLAFCKTRKLCELVAAYTRDLLEVSLPGRCLGERVKVCGGGVRWAGVGWHCFMGWQASKRAHDLLKSHA